MSSILRVPYLVRCQVGCDDQRLLTAVGQILRQWHTGFQIIRNCIHLRFLHPNQCPDSLRLLVSTAVQAVFYVLKIPAGTVYKNQQLLIVLRFGKNIRVFTKTHFPPPDKILLRSLNLTHHGCTISQTTRGIDAFDSGFKIFLFDLVESFLMPLNVLLEGRYKLIAL